MRFRVHHNFSLITKIDGDAVYVLSVAESCTSQAELLNTTSNDCIRDLRGSDVGIPLLKVLVWYVTVYLTIEVKHVIV